MFEQGDTTKKQLLSPLTRDKPDPYTVLRRLGQDAAGETFLALDNKRNRNFRLRVIPPGVLDDDARNELLDRVLVAGSIGHPHLEKVYWIRRDDQDSVLLATEYLPGLTLRILLAEQGKILWPRARTLLLQIADGLAAIHEHGLTHGDLRPATVVLVQQPGGEDHVKIVDPGLAPALGGADFLSECAAPEQLRGQAVDARTDVYAFGCLVYHLLMGEAPFSSGSTFDRLGQQQARQIKSLVEPGRAVSPDLQAILLKAIEPEPGDRYGSMRDIVLALEACPAAPPVKDDVPPPAAPAIPSHGPEPRTFTLQSVGALNPDPRRPPPGSAASPLGAAHHPTRVLAALPVRAERPRAPTPDIAPVSSSPQGTPAQGVPTTTLLLRATPVAWGPVTTLPVPGGPATTMLLGTPAREVPSAATHNDELPSQAPSRTVTSGTGTLAATRTVTPGTGTLAATRTATPGTGTLAATRTATPGKGTASMFATPGRGTPLRVEPSSSPGPSHAGTPSATWLQPRRGTPVAGGAGSNLRADDAAAFLRRTNREEPRGTIWWLLSVLVVVVALAGYVYLRFPDALQGL